MGLDGVELIMEVEKAFTIQIPDREAENILTVGDLYNSVWNHVEKEGADRKAIETKINQVIVDTLGVSLKKISPEKGFIDDFGVD